MSRGISSHHLPPGSRRPPPLPVRRFSVEEYHRMGEVGVLSEDDRVELLEGWIVPKMTHGPEHDATIDHVHDLLRSRLPEGWRIRIRSAVTTGDSEPEPDLAVVPGPASRYARRHPEAHELAVLIEVAETSLEDDRALKGRLYARASVPTYWSIKLVDRQVEVYSDPSGPAPVPAFQTHKVYRPGEAVPLLIGGKEIAPVQVQDLLGAVG